MGARRWRARLAALMVVATVAVPLAVAVQPTVAGASPGALDPSFGTGGLVTTTVTAGATDVVNGVATQSDGKIVAAGYDQPSGGVQRFALARYNTDGTLDSSFGTGGKVTTTIAAANGNGDAALAVAIQGNGKIVVGGYTSTISGGSATEDMALVRYNADGTLDTSFGTSGITTVVAGSNAFTNQINALAIDSFGRIVVAGQYDNGWVVGRFSTSGTLDTSFNSSGTQPGFQLAFPSAVTTTDNANAVAIQPGDQKVVVSGSANANADFGVGRLNTDGTLDTSFGTTGVVDTPVGGTQGTAYGVAVQGDGNIVAVGQSGDNNVGDHLDVALARYSGAGVLDGTFGTGGIVSTPIGTNKDAAGRAVSLQTDGQIVVGGYFQAAVGGDDIAALRYSTSNGHLDSTFGTGGIVTTNTGGGADDFGNAVALEPGSLGAIVVAGSDQPSLGSPRFLLARYFAADPPSITKSFGAASIPVGGTTSLTFTISNPNTGGIGGVAFTDSLPAGLVVATPNGLTSTCGGTTTAVAGSGSVTLSGGSLAASASCSVVVTVQGTSGGVKNNSVTVTSDNGPGNTSNASLTVIAPPVIIKAFGAASVPLSGSTSLTFTVQNNNAGSTLTGVGFGDTLPSGLVVSNPNGLTGSCGGGTITAVAGSGSVSLSGATIAASAQCTFSINV
ncbi:MAG TPA: hypothetical protein VNV87_01065, partial [Acidimicrobiales bacterium]|nr:hypothetical protein [Acidimicrobiales bacterium]